MNTMEDSPWQCNICHRTAITYADGGVWCNKCEKKLLDTERTDISRGEQRNTMTPPWTKVPTE